MTRPDAEGHGDTAGLRRARVHLLLGMLAVVGLLVAGVWAMSRPAVVPADSRAVRLDRAERTPGAWPGAPSPAPAASASAAVVLPDVWRRQLPKLSGVNHYRLQLPPARWGGVSAVYVPRLGNRAQVWLDGELLASFGDLLNGQQDYSPRPLLVTAHRFTDATTAPHELVIEVGGSATRFSGLSEVWWGPAAELEARHAARDTLLLTSAGLAGGGSLLLGGLGLALAVWRRNAMLGFFGLAGLAAGSRALLWIWRDPLVPYTTWYAAMDACFGLWACSIAWFALRVAEIRQPVLEWGLRFLMALMVPATLLAAADLTTRPKELWLDLTLVTAGVITAALIARAWRRPDGVGVSLALGAVTVVTLSGTDHWNIFFSPDPGAYVRPYFSHHMALLFSLFMAASLAARFDRAVRIELALRQGLADEVEAQRRELEALHARERERLDAQAAQRERHRIMQDMHDGLGAHLTGLLTLVQRGPMTQEELEREVAEAIDHLRLTVDAASLEGATVTDVLAQLRFRLEPRLRRMGLQIEWVLEDLPGPLSVEAASHLQKIVLEALSNALRHAQARTIRLSARTVAGAREVRIADDGRGRPTETVGAPPTARGQGVRHMQARAQSLGVQLRFEVPEGGGTAVVLTWPKGEQGSPT